MEIDKKKILSDFSTYLEKNEYSYIKNYSIKELEQAQMLLVIEEHSGNPSRAYRALKIKLLQLREIRNRRDKWIDRTFGFMVGIITTLIGIFVF